MRPIALIEPSMSVLVISSKGLLAEKVRSNIEQVKARGGRVIAIGSDSLSWPLADARVEVPESSEWLAPILNYTPARLAAAE